MKISILANPKEVMSVLFKKRHERKQLKELQFNLYAELVWRLKHQLTPALWSEMRKAEEVVFTRRNGKTISVRASPQLKHLRFIGGWQPEAIYFDGGSTLLYTFIENDMRHLMRLNPTRLSVESLYVAIHAVTSRTAELVALRAIDIEMRRLRKGRSNSIYNELLYPGRFNLRTNR